MCRRRRSSRDAHRRRAAPAIPERGVAARSEAMISAAPRKKVNGDTSIRPYRIGTSSGTRVSACCSSSSIGSGRRGDGAHVGVAAPRHLRARRLPTRRMFVRRQMGNRACRVAHSTVLLVRLSMIQHARRRQADAGARASAGRAIARAPRGRGIASAIKRAQIAWARERGLRTLRAANETRLAGMLALNRRLGYRLLYTEIVLRGPAAAVESPA